MSDKDSLFGSPPPSPSTRGRSPSLALPESSGWRLEDAQTSSQNVGTIALPGSQSHSSELPVFLTPALPSENNVLQLRPPAQRAQAPLRRQNTNHTARSVSSLHSPAHHTIRTDQTLRDLVGLISHFEPVAAAPSSRRPPTTAPSPRASQDPEFCPPGSAQNPIEIDIPEGPADAVNSALVALAGTVASALKLPTAPRDSTSLSQPTVNNVLHCIKHDPKLIPALKATYEYLGSIPNNSQTTPRPTPDVTTDQPDPTSSKRRKRKRKHSGPQVPAGAGHWNVPFPFAPGKEPSGYPSQWHLERGRRVLGELLGLFERAFAKARGAKRTKTSKAPSQQPTKKQRRHAVTSADGCEVEGSVAGNSDQGTIPVATVNDSGLDYQRMTDWLSSVPPRPSSTVNSTNFTDTSTPCTSDPSPLPHEPLLDFMAMLGPNVPDAPTPSVDDRELDFDFEGAFDGLDAGVAGSDMPWQSILGSDPTSQSINDLVAFSMSDIQSSATHPGTNGLVWPQSDPQSSLLGPPKDSQYSGTQATAFDMFASLMNDEVGSFCQQSCDRPVPTEAGLNNETGDMQSVDAHSLCTVPTALGSSSQGGPTPSVSASGSMSPAPSAIAGSSASGPPTKTERKAAALAKAREYRDQLLKELEHTQVQRWELLIEGGVLRNLVEEGGQ